MNAPESEEAIFAEALRLPPEERAGYLDHATQGNAELLRRVAALLRSYSAGEFLEQAASSDLRDNMAMSIPFTEKVGDRISRYKLLQQIGEGGCGVVYMAEQEEPVRRRVALKIIKLGMDTKTVIARFEAERQALAMMDHPNIAKVFDAGATETGRPYFVMELVRGIRITDYCDEQKLSTRGRLDLFIQVCQAIQHAHQKGIIHRDIKPSNILVTINDGVAVPKVIDFGIAKATSGQQLTDKTVFTAFEQFIGTPAYMSPEQAVLTSLDIDTRSDIYALGVLLYELLTGKTPFDAKELLAIGLDELRRTIRDKEPDRPSTRLSALGGSELSTTAQHRGLDALKLVSELRGDLDWIVMKALEKDRARRYETASGFAADIQRHLNNEPVAACPPSRLYRFQKMARRNKLAFAAGMSVAATLVMGLGVSTWMFIEQRAALKRAVAAELEQTRLRQVAEANEKKAASEAAKSHEVAKFLQNMLVAAGPAIAKGRDTTVLREVLDWTASRVGRNLTNQPAVEAELRHFIGVVYHNIGEYKKAEQMHREALRLGRALFGSTNEFVANSLYHLSLPLEKLNPPEAETTAREALSIRKALFGNEHSNVVMSIQVVANTLAAQHKLAEAETVIREALALSKKQLGDEHSVALSLNNLGAFLQAQGKLAEAERVYRDALAMETRLKGSDNPDAAGTLGNLGIVLAHQGKWGDAELLCREALAILRKAYGNEHPSVVDKLQTLCWILDQQKKLAEAEAAVREALTIARKRGDHASITESVTQLAGVLKAQGKVADAESLYREALETSEKLNDDHTQQVITVLSLGILLRDEGKLSEAETNFREGLALAANSRSGASHPNLGPSVWLLTDLLKRQDRLPEEALAIYKSLPQAAHGPRTELLRQWMGLLFQEGKLADADKFLTETLAQDAASPLETALFLKIRGRYFGDHGQFQKAIADLSRSVELNPRDSDAPWHWLAPLLVYTGQLDAYRELCRRILEQSETTDPGIAERIAKDCLIIPSSEIDLKTVARLADFAVNRDKAHRYYSWFQLVKATAEYRQGNFSTALAWLEKIPATVDGTAGAQVWGMKAMALHQLGHAEKALAALTHARELAKTPLAELETAKPPVAWNDWITAKLWIAEAAELIERRPHAFENPSP